jgi:hypothetical protein
MSNYGNNIPPPTLDNCDQIADSLRDNSNELSKLIDWNKEDKLRAAEERQKSKKNKKRQSESVPSTAENTSVPNVKKQKQLSKSEDVRDISLYRRKCKAYWNVMPHKLIDAGFSRPDFEKVTEQAARALVDSYQQHFAGMGIFTVAPEALRLFAKGVEYASIQADKAFGVGNIKYYSDDVAIDDEVTALVHEFIIDETSMTPMTPRKRLLLKLVEKASNRYAINKNTKTYSKLLTKTVPDSIQSEFSDL